jgi:hypothetical protein
VRQAHGERAGAAAWEQMDRTRQIEVLQTMIERVGYNGATRQISIRFRPSEDAGQEARA